MAGITQNIPAYTSGISQQPDQIKFPGQVVDTENSIPHPIFGLMKRPGSKRIGAAPLTNVQSNGTWFHYYRDETEGAYIGQVASDGKVRIWSCNDGAEKNVWYHTDNSAYSGGNSDHTSITSYLTPSSATNTEDIQALTINDTTFLNNRTKTVTTTGTTPARNATHEAYLELLRSENGRQYAVNIATPTGSTTTVKRATRLKITADTLEEVDGTGSCPGIGTQVFAHTETHAGKAGGVPSDVANLTFRITALGQQGVSPTYSYDDTNANPDGANYRCTYSREIVLLHGGEGWETNHATTVTLDTAKGGDGNIGNSFSTNATYTVTVMDHEEATIKADVKAVRPVPTPFDADTAVTADTILAGIVTECSGLTVGGQALNTQIIGNGIYFSCANAFNIEIGEQDLMRVMHSSVNDVTKLPNTCKHGYIVKVSNTRMADEDDYYVKFLGANNGDGTGAWQECAKPGIVLAFTDTTMPHVLQRQADGDFLVKKFVWADRTVGDDTTNPIPSFADGSSTINKVLFFRNRLAFLSGENVITCKPGTLGVPDFWVQTALTTAVVDPIDIACSSTYPSELFDGVETVNGLILFSSNQQFLLASDDTIFQPDTAKLKSIATYNYNVNIPPIDLGMSFGFVDNSGKYSRFQEIVGISRELKPTIVEASKVVPHLLPKDIDLLANSKENDTVFLGKTDSDIVYLWRYWNVADKREQSAWFKWKFNNPLKYHFSIDDDYYYLDTDNFLQKVSLVQKDSDPSIDQDSVNYLIHLDNYTTISSGSYDATTKKTTFTNQSTWIPNVTTPNGSLVLIDIDSNATRIARYAECTLTGNTPNDDFTVPGDWSSATLYIGYLYEYNVKFPKIYPTKQQTADRVTSDINGSLIIHRIKLSFGKIGLYNTTLERVGKSDYTEIYESSLLDEYDVSDAPYLSEYIKTIPIYERNKNVDITLKSSHPAPANLRSMSWEGDFNTKLYQRA
tara:strand:+ start:240 stop:3137 length:2898 start_codon:yes stop_codon:yes gene_type:complete